MTERLLALVRFGIVALVAVVGLVLAFHMSALGPGSSPGGDRDQSAFAAPEGVVFVASTPGPGMISGESAIKIALEHYQGLNTEAQVDAYLGTTTDANTAETVKDRLVWIVHLSGIAMPVSVPGGVKNPPRPADMSNGYIYIDAYSGAWLISRFED